MLNFEYKSFEDFIAHNSSFFLYSLFIMPPTVRDRTQEFFATISSYENVMQSNSHSQNRNRRVVSKTSEDQSSRIINSAQNISQTIVHCIQNVHELQRR